MVDTYLQKLAFEVSGGPSGSFAVYRMSGREAIS